MSWKSVKSGISILIVSAVSLLFGSVVIAEGEGRNKEKYGYSNEWMYGMMLFSPNFEKEPKLTNLDVHSVVAVDTFGGLSEGVWKWMYSSANESNESWLHATYIEGDIVPHGNLYNVQDFFDAIFMVRSNTFTDMYDLLENGWILGDMQHDLIDASLTESGDQYFFVPRNFDREQLDRIWETIYVDNTVYRIPTEHAHSFSYSDGLN